MSHIDLPSELLEMWAAFDQTGNPEDKQEIAMQMADLYSMIHPDLDPTLPAALHDMVTKYELSRLEWLAHGRKLAFYVMELLKDAPIAARVKSNPDESIH